MIYIVLKYFKNLLALKKFNELEMKRKMHQLCNPMQILQITECAVHREYNTEYFCP